jgi:hypothetical protein
MRWRSIRRALAVALALAAAAVLPTAAFGAGDIHELRDALGDRDTRTGQVAPTEEQLRAAESLGASVSWNRFGTPASLVKDGDFLATGLPGDSAAAAARAFLEANGSLFRLSSAATLELVNDAPLAGSDGHAVLFRETMGGLAAAEDGKVTVGVTGTAATGWNVASASSTLSGGPALAAKPSISAEAAFVKAARDVGRPLSILDVRSSRKLGEWRVLGVNGLLDSQRVRGPFALPVPGGAARPVFETLVVDELGGLDRAFTHFVDAATGSVLVRRDLVDYSHPVATTFSGAVLGPDSSCDSAKGPWLVAPGENVASVAVAVENDRQANDAVLRLRRDGKIVQSADVDTSPEVIAYSPDGGVAPGSYTVQVCDFADGAAWEAPQSYVGQIAFVTSATGSPSWNVFPSSPRPPQLSASPWDVPSVDIRESWCWEAAAGCDDAVANSASRVPWDVSPRTNAPTFQTVGNNAVASEAWTDPLAPGPTFRRPMDVERSYDFPWANTWYASNCSPSGFVAGGNDIDAAVTNLFVMHNRMHDWSYHLGFTEQAWNGQEENFGTGTSEHDPVLGQAQAGAGIGQLNVPQLGPLGRDNANMRTLPDGVSSITNMYLWQPLKGALYPPCVDGDYDMSVIGHEYGHMIENRMIGKGSGRSGHHAGAMGESNGDLNAMEILNEYGFVPVAGENRYSVGAFATGNKQAGIRNYGMNQSPLNFSNMGYDVTGPQVHADGEIWSAVNFDLRQALAKRYDGQYASSNAGLQRACADGERPADTCPGNRRWVQLMYDAYLLMPSAPSMLDARDAYLAADLMRFGGANQKVIWNAFARRGFGEGAVSSNLVTTSDVDPKPDFASPRESEASIRFLAVAKDEGLATIRNARVFVGQYEARTSPIADTDPATSAGGPGADNLDDRAAFVPGTYELVVQAPGYGHHRFARTFTAGQTATVKVELSTNWASAAKGATPAGDGTDQGSLIDDTEGTNWLAAGAPVAGKEVTVDLAGGARSVKRVQVSALLGPGQNRFTALRSFELWVCRASCGTEAGFTKAYASPPDAFPGRTLRPTAPELLLRSFVLPTAVTATHVRLVVSANQCTGNPAYHGVQDADPVNPTDCRTGEEPSEDAPGSLPARDTEVRAAELQVFSR